MSRLAGCAVLSTVTSRDSVISNEECDFGFLNTVLTQYEPDCDVPAMSAALLDRFGSLGGIVSASRSDLRAISGVSHRTAVMLNNVHSFRIRISRSKLKERPIIDNSTAVREHLRVYLRHLKHEEIVVMYLDNSYSLIADEVHTRGTVDSVSIYPREIVKRALDVGATKLVIAHNHPSRIDTPSFKDMQATKSLISACSAFDISVLDHVIVAGDGYLSFKSLGLL